ncbi:MAG: carbonic anhydrase [Patescibacteria group bacterium]|jgi:carbonic anhydrase
MSHTCQAIVFRCIDFRIQSGVFAKLLAENGICAADQFDLVSLAGAAKVFLTDSRDLLLSQIDISSRLHGIKKVVLVMHDNCGAYGIADPAEEEKIQRQDLAEIAGLIAAKFSQLTVEKFILQGTASGNFSLLKI